MNELSGLENKNFKCVRKYISFLLTLFRAERKLPKNDKCLSSYYYALMNLHSVATESMSKVFKFYLFYIRYVKK